jgi:hypothetical protein
MSYICAQCFIYASHRHYFTPLKRTAVAATAFGHKALCLAIQGTEKVQIDQSYSTPADLKLIHVPNFRGSPGDGKPWYEREHIHYEFSQVDNNPLVEGHYMTIHTARKCDIGHSNRNFGRVELKSVHRDAFIAKAWDVLRDRCGWTAYEDVRDDLFMKEEHTLRIERSLIGLVREALGDRDGHSDKSAPRLGSWAWLDAQLIRVSLCNLCNLCKQPAKVMLLQLSGLLRKRFLHIEVPLV